jgi:rhodanese-related sulfurtransferase
VSSSEIAADALLADIQSGVAPAIVDVRSRWEFTRGHVPGATHIPFWALAARISDVPASRASPVVLYCGHGPRAYFAGALLRAFGFKHVHYLRGHMWQWRRAHRPEQMEVGPPG